VSVEIRNWMTSKYKKNLPLVELSVETVSSGKISNASYKKAIGSGSANAKDADTHNESAHHGSDSSNLNRIVFN